MQKAAWWAERARAGIAVANIQKVLGVLGYECRQFCRRPDTDIAVSLTRLSAE